MVQELRSAWGWDALESGVEVALELLVVSTA